MRLSEATNLIVDLQHVWDEDIPVYQMDEAVFSFKDYHNTAWSNSKQNVAVQHYYMPQCVAVICFSSNNRIVHFFCKHRSIRKPDLVEQTIIFRQKLGNIGVNYL